MPVFQQALRSIRAETNVCVISCISNFLCDSKASTTSVAHRVDPVITEFFDQILEACRVSPDRKFLVCPPMYRTNPTWYRVGLSEILNRFSDGYGRAAIQVQNLHALPGFPSQSLENDGIHLNPYSGLEFVLHLFDSAKVLLDSCSGTPAAREAIGTEATRVLGDRVIALEQDHRRLAAAFDHKSAVDAELACFRTNERNEDSFLLSGLRRIREGLNGREWQVEAKREVSRILKLITDQEFRIIVVHNVTGRGSSSPVTFSVRLDRVDDARMIRAKFSSFFSGGTDSRPASLQDVSVRNVLTKETRIRISILKLLGQRYQDSNQGASYQVIGYESRPLLKLTPPKGTADRRIKSYNYIEAVQKLPVNFSDEELTPIVKQIGSKFPGRLQELFIVLDDDRVREIRRSSSASSRNKRTRGADVASGDVGDDDEPPRQRHAEGSE